MVDAVPIRANRPGESSDRSPQKAAVSLRGVTVLAGPTTILEDATLDIPEQRVTAIIGPSGSGKSTLLKSINRLLDLVEPRLRVRGSVRVGNQDVYSKSTDADELRTEVGMLFQQPVVFPCSIERNVLFGVARLESLGRAEAKERLRAALQQAALWEDVRERLRRPATELSVGQQQRLCLARALATQPSVLLMDEPTSALDPKATWKIEQLILELSKSLTVVVVTHDLAQAHRIADHVALVSHASGVGRVVEAGPNLLDHPTAPASIDYLRRSIP